MKFYNTLLLSLALALECMGNDTLSCKEGYDKTCMVEVRPTVATNQSAKSAGWGSDCDMGKFNSLSKFEVSRDWSTTRLFNKMNTQFLNKKKCFR